MTRQLCWPILALGALSACGILESSPAAKDLTFEVREVDYWSPGPPRQIVLLVHGDTIYPCMNYEIEGDLQVQGRLIRVTMSGAIQTPQICLTAIGPAVFRAALGITDGPYTLDFVRRGVTDRYILNVTQAAIEITPLQMHFTQPAARRFPRLG